MTKIIKKLAQSGKYVFRHSLLSIKELTKFEWNPVSRSKENTKQFNVLKKAIEDNDNTIFQDILVAELQGEGYVIIDGHRRLAVASLLKMQTVPCKIISANAGSDIDSDKLFQDLNNSQFKINGVQWTEMYLAGGSEILPKRIKEFHDDLKRIAGVELMRKLAAKGIAGSTVSRAITAICKKPRNSNDDKKKIVVWIEKHGCQTLIRDKNILKFTDEEIWKCIDADKKLPSTKKVKNHVAMEVEEKPANVS